MAATTEELLIKIRADSNDLLKSLKSVEDATNKSGKTAGDNLAKGFKTGSSSLDDMGDKIGDLGRLSQGSASDFINAFSRSALNPVLLSVAAVGAAIGGAFKLSQAGEQINAINSQFDSLASGSKLSTQTLRDGLEEATQGLYDMEDVLKAATGAVVDLGINANRIPEIFKIAQSASRALGVDAIETFDKINAAIASGNTKALKQVKIFIDTDEVLKQYAATLGITSDQLNQSQKQQALLNAVIEQGSEKYKNIDQSITPISDSLKRLGVAFDNISDSVATAASNNFGGFFSGFINGVAGITNQLAGPKGPREELAKLRSELANGVFINFDTGQEDTGREVTIKNRIALLEKEIAVKNQQKIIDDQLFRIEQTDIGVKNQKAAAAAARTKLIQDNAKLELEAEKLLTQSKIQNLLSISNAEKEKENFDLANAARKQAEELTNQQNLLNIENQYGALKQANRIVYNQIVEAEENRHKLALDSIEAAKTDAAILEQRKRDELTDVFFNGFRTKINDSLKVIAAGGVAINNFGNLTKAALGQSLTQGFSSAAKAIANGENAFASFRDGAMNAIADVISAVGEGLIAQGILNILSLNPLGAIQVAGGTGLKILAELIRPASVSSSVPSASASIPSVPSSNLTAGITPSVGSEFVADEKRRVDTSVSVVVNGSIYDSDETGSRIVDLINSAFDKKGVSITQGAYA